MRSSKAEVVECHLSSIIHLADSWELGSALQIPAYFTAA